MEDARKRTKTFLEKYLSDAAITDDGNVDEVYYTVMYSDAEYSVVREMMPYDNYCLSFLIGQPISIALETYDYKTYGFIEKVPIIIAAINRTGVSAQRLIWKAENELRRIIISYPLGSIRLMDTRRDKIQKIGVTTLYQSEFIMYYKRDSDYVASCPTITWGDWCGEGEPGELDGTFIFPNVTSISYPNGVPDVKLLPPGRIGNIKQVMGDTSLMVRLTCDLDVASYPSLTWKRPQDYSPKEDATRWQVILDIKHNGAINAPYQTLTLDWGSFKVRLVDFDVRQEGEGNILEVTFEEYNPTSATGLYTDRYGIT